MREATFDLELSTTQVNSPGDYPHVFISGLARAGTTLLLRSFYAGGEFHSLTYRDMPFVLMPNLWRQLSSAGRKKHVTAERAHGDGVHVGFDSPEALEEVFWTTFCDASYRQRDRLVPHSVKSPVLEKFVRYVGVIMQSRGGGKLYLSKNNNSVLRLSALRAAFPRAQIIVPFREPMAQAHSLLTQHVRFCERHRADPFSLSYMTWLAHHEFGLTHRPFVFSDGEFEALEKIGPERIEYWLLLWTNVYRYLLAEAPEGTVFMGYEQFCSDPRTVLRDVLRVPGNLNAMAMEVRAPVADSAEHVALPGETARIYAALRERWRTTASS